MKDKYVYLPFRALGDFVITAAIVKNNFVSKIPILLPNYLKELFFEINADQYFTIVDYITFPHYPKLFELHKIKTMADVKGFIGDYKIVTALNRKIDYVVDANCKRLFLSGQKFIYPTVEGNVYDTRLTLLSKIFDLQTRLTGMEENLSHINKIVVFPGSRKKSKEIDYLIVKEIYQYFKEKNINIDVAYHLSEKPGIDSGVPYQVFRNFSELRNLIESYDFIISADSLPIHFAYYLNKPNYCLYNEISNEKWLTPLGVKNQFFSVIVQNGKSYGKNIFSEIESKGYTFEKSL